MLFIFKLAVIVVHNHWWSVSKYQTPNLILSLS